MIIGVKFFIEVVSKVVARLVQNLLQIFAEHVFPESQCSFRKGRGCNDMIFTVSRCRRRFLNIE